MIPTTLLLAQRNHTDPIQGFFDGLHSAMRPNTVGPPAIMLILGFVGGIVALLLIMAVIKSRRSSAALDPRHGRPMKLFSQALRKLGVSWPDRLLMRAVARKARLQHPTVMLFSRPLLERHVARWTDSVSVAPLRTHLRSRVKGIAAKVFS